MQSICAHSSWQTGAPSGSLDVAVAKELREALRDTACHRFTTVLGPGSDSSMNRIFISI